jgi:hypothetical protein
VNPAARRLVGEIRVYFFLLLRVGLPLRFVFAIFLSSLSLIELAICRDAPLSDDFDFLPRFAASAAPAAICCFFDFAGIHNSFAPNEDFGFMKQSQGPAPAKAGSQWKHLSLTPHFSEVIAGT